MVSRAGNARRYSIQHSFDSQPAAGRRNVCACCSFPSGNLLARIEISRANRLAPNMARDAVGCGVYGNRTSLSAQGVDRWLRDYIGRLDARERT